jgi:hypothetical protein
LEISYFNMNPIIHNIMDDVKFIKFHEVSYQMFDCKGIYRRIYVYYGLYQQPPHKVLKV